MWDEINSFLSKLRLVVIFIIAIKLCVGDSILEGWKTLGCEAQLWKGAGFRTLYSKLGKAFLSGEGWARQLGTVSDNNVKSLQAISIASCPACHWGGGVGNYAQRTKNGLPLCYLSAVLRLGVSVSHTLGVLYFLNHCLLVHELRIVTYGIFSSQRRAQHNVGSQLELPGLICLIWMLQEFWKIHDWDSDIYFGRR